MENCKVDDSAKGSLMQALCALENKATALLDVANLSYRVVGKLKDPRPGPSRDEDDLAETELVNEPTLDLIDLFNGVSDRLGVATEVISVNLNRIKSIIE